jgi:ATP-dependent Clp protease ATP-binding subunit ClpB
VFNVLLQILDDGRLTDSQGRTVDFKNAVVIMTSNIGSPLILEHRGEDWALVETQVLAQLRAHFRPEFLNRVDDIVVFRPLGEGDIAHIVDLQLDRLRRLMADRKLTLQMSGAAKAFVAHEGYDPAFGARPLKRAVQRLVQDPLAMAVLEGRFPEGSTVVVELVDGRLTFAEGV